MLNRLFDRLSRVTSSGRFIPEIDGLRFVAIAVVILGHICGYTLIKDNLARRGTAELEGFSRELLGHFSLQAKWGVNLFFAISGFILALPFVEHACGKGKRVSIRKYFLRRLTRLEPPYLFNLVILVALSIVFNQQNYGPQELLSSFFASVFYQHWLIFAKPSIINFVTWSLEIEVQFYCLVPLLAGVFLVRNRFGRRWSIVSAMLALACLQQVPICRGSARFTLSVLEFGQYFLAGLLLADIFVNDWHEKPSHSPWWDVVSLFGWPSLCVIAEIPVVNHFLEPSLIFLLFMATLKGVLFRRLLRLRPIAVIGGMCYTLYLWHMAIISVFGRFQKLWMITDSIWVHLALATVVLSIPILIISSILFVLVERPCMRRDWPQTLTAWLRHQASTNRRISGSHPQGDPENPKNEPALLPSLEDASPPAVSFPRTADNEFA